MNKIYKIINLLLCKNLSVLNKKKILYQISDIVSDKLALKYYIYSYRLSFLTITI